MPEGPFCQIRAHMLLVLKRTVSMRQFVSAPKTYVKTDGLEKIYVFTLKIFVYLNLYMLICFLLLGHWIWPGIV